MTYDAYGMARHHWKADVTGDGAVGSADRNAASAALNKSIGDSAYNVDADVTRTGTVTTTDGQWFNSNNFKAALPKGDLSAYGNVIGFSGYVFNPEVPTTGGGGLYTVRFRHYDAELGRWLERDPLGYVDGMNLYGYVANNPLTGFDPLGLEDRKKWTEEEKEKAIREFLRKLQEIEDKEGVKGYDPTWGDDDPWLLRNLTFDTIYGDTDIDWLLTILYVHYYGVGGWWILKGQSAWYIYHIGKLVWIAIDDPTLRAYRQENELNAINAAQDIIDGKRSIKELFPPAYWPEETEGAEEGDESGTTPRRRNRRRCFGLL